MILTAHATETENAMPDMLNFDRDDVRNIRMALESFRDLLKSEHATIPGTEQSPYYAEFAELAERMTRVVTMTGESF